MDGLSESLCNPRAARAFSSFLSNGFARPSRADRTTHPDTHAFRGGIDMQMLRMLNWRNVFRVD